MLLRTTTAVVITLLVTPALLTAQDMCAVTGTPAGPSMQVINSVHFTITGNKNIGCTIVAAMNANCMTSGTYLTNAMSSATRMVTGLGTGTNPTCQFNCGIKPGAGSPVGPVLCTISMNSMNGLPVELMEFSVEDGEESAEGEPEPDAGG